MPTGAPLREDGDTHLQAWERILRRDSCSYCDQPLAGTVDHITPKAARSPLTYHWSNLAGACDRCNQSKRDQPMLLWLARRRVLRRS